MGMSTFIQAIKLPDDNFKKMKDVYNACINAGVSVPDAVTSYFNNEPPDDLGVIISHYDLNPDWYLEYCKDEKKGYTVLLGKLPPDITAIRIYNSW